MVKRKPKNPRKGFNRSKKEWEESIATHIGKFIDKLDGNQIMTLLSNAIVGYAGFKAVEKLSPGYWEEVEPSGPPGSGGVGGKVWHEGANLEMKLGGAASAIIALKLASSMNLVAGASGTAYLASLGLINFWDPITNTIKGVFPFYMESVDSPVSTFPFIIPHIFP